MELVKRGSDFGAFFVHVLFTSCRTKRGKRWSAWGDFRTPLFVAVRKSPHADHRLPLLVLHEVNKTCTKRAPKIGTPFYKLHLDLYDRVRNPTPIWAAVMRKVIPGLVPLEGRVIVPCDFGSFWCIWPLRRVKKAQKRDEKYLKCCRTYSKRFLTA